MENLLSVTDAAQRLGISQHTLNCWVSKRKVPFVKLGRRTLFDLPPVVVPSFKLGWGYRCG